MSRVLELDFERAFPSGPRIEARLTADFDAAPVLALFGPSGVGKTTILRCLAGLDEPQRGRIEFAGVPWFDSVRRIHVASPRRRIGYVPQEQALFPHLTVRRNIAYGGAHADSVDRQLHLVGAASLADRRPSQLSGGQRQRVALARALARRPSLLLLDEPLSSVDDAGREELRDDLRRVIRSSGTPAIVVTHDRDEALQLADAVAILAGGRVVQVGPIEHVFSRPADASAAAVVGIESVIPGTVLDNLDGLSTVEVGSARLTAVNDRALQGRVSVCIRAVDVVLSREGSPDSARNKLRGTVTAIRPGAILDRIDLDCGFPLSALVTRLSRTEMGIEPGAALIASVKAPNVHLVSRDPKP